VGLARSLSAVRNPIFNRVVFIPSIVASKYLDTLKAWSVEDLVLLIQKGNGVLCCLVFVNKSFNFRNESSVLLNVLMLVNHIGMASWQAFNVLEILLVSLLMDPRVINLHLLRLESLMLFFSKQ
jgi:hypothetical protein